MFLGLRMERCKCLSNNKNTEKYLDSPVPFWTGGWIRTIGGKEFCERKFLGMPVLFSFLSLDNHEHQGKADLVECKDFIFFSKLRYN